MSPVPEGAQLSADGHYWWDGIEWKPVDGGQSGEVTHEELAAIKHEDQIEERHKSYFQPDYDKVPDDDSWAEAEADLPE
jgi:hypothetical protein